MTERHNGFRFNNGSTRPIEHGRAKLGKYGIVVILPSNHTHMDRLHNFLGPVADSPRVTIAEALSPGTHHRSSDAFLELRQGGENGGLLGKLAGTVDHVFIIASMAQVNGIVPLIVHDLNNGSSCLQQNLTICLIDGDPTFTANLNRGVGKLHGFSARRLSPTSTGLDLINRVPPSKK